MIQCSEIPAYIVATVSEKETKQSKEEQWVVTWWFVPSLATTTSYIRKVGPSRRGKIL